MSKPPLTSLAPVFGTSGCVGHVMRNAHGYVAHNRDDKIIGIFSTQSAATEALLALNNNQETT